MPNSEIVAVTQKYFIIACQTFAIVKSAVCAWFFGVTNASVIGDDALQLAKLF